MGMLSGFRRDSYSCLSVVVAALPLIRTFSLSSVGRLEQYLLRWQFAIIHMTIYILNNLALLSVQGHGILCSPNMDMLLSGKHSEKG